MLGIFLDIETSGLDSFHHRVLEIAFKIVDLEVGEEKYSYQSIVKQPKEVWEKRDLTSIEINGFTWEKALLGKEEFLIRREIIEIFTYLNIERGKGVFICQNPAFDRGFFSQLIDVYTQEQQQWPYHWLDFASMYWALRVKEGIIPDNEFHLSKNAIAQHFQLPIENYPHSAMNGVDHLLLCYRTVVGFGSIRKWPEPLSVS
jgi:oligoribonuclease